MGWGLSAAEVALEGLESARRMSYSTATLTLEIEEVCWSSGLGLDIDVEESRVLENSSSENCSFGSSRFG